jgi:hypothetical protein
VGVRATFGSAASAYWRVATSVAPLASARTNSAGSLLGARPASLMATTVSTTRVPSSAMSVWMTAALSFVSFCSVT